MDDWLSEVELSVAGEGLALRVEAMDRTGSWLKREYAAPGREHDHYLDLFQAVAADFATRTPLARTPAPSRPAHPALTPVLTEPVHADVLYGYGDPAVMRVETLEGPRWWLYVTSNDAPDAFPILTSTDLIDWRFAGFAFPRGATPEWALTGEGLADFWAPETHRVGDEFWLCFAARARDRSLAVGLARAADPRGPFTPNPAPLVSGGVIDPHIVMAPDGAPYLLWKEDSNEHWPRGVAALLGAEPGLARHLFHNEADRRTVVLCSRLLAEPPAPEPMEAFFRLHPLIEAAAEDFPAFRRRLGRLAADIELPPDLRALATEALAASVTRILARRLADDGTSLIGETTVVLVNDQVWEAHLVEGVWVQKIGGTHHLFYAANDFSNARYGVGVATADHPLGPYAKAAEPFIQSSADWVAPGHPSVTINAAGEPQMFLHAFPPGRAGYKAFRALMTARLALRGGRLELAP